MCTIEIRFYKVNDSYGFLSNFSPHLIYLDGAIWATVEHFFQASKFEDRKIRERISLLDSPMKAAIEGRSRDYTLRINWEEVKEDIMFRALTAKFLQHPDLKSELIKTGEALIIEDTINDSYWGNGGDNSGKNRLGILLMEVREKIKNISPDANIVFPPWIAFAGISQFDLFWRMGLGEEYLSKWSAYFLKCEDKAIYIKSFPAGIDWEDIYD